MGVSTIAPDRPLIVWEPSASVPAGYIKANGAVLSRSVYAWLFGRIGETFGAGDGSTTFEIPDLRGEFLRGLDDGRGVDVGRLVGSVQSDMFESHRHTLTTNTGPAGATFQGDIINFQVASNSGPVNKTVSYTGGDETRPRNVAGLYCIAYAP